jgi:hypothetical protein
LNGWLYNFKTKIHGKDLHGVKKRKCGFCILCLIETKYFMIRYCLPFFFLFSILSQKVTAQDSTYRGREFWVGYGHHQFMESGANSQELVLYLSTRQDPATVTISIDSASTPWSKTYNIPANTVIISDLIPKSGSSDARLFSPDPAMGGTGSTGIFRRKGIHIESDVPIAVYSHLYGSASAGASMVLPVQTWGYTYRSLNSKQQYAGNCFSWAYIIAKENNTTIEITPSVLTRNQLVSGLAPGVAKQVTLQKGQIYQVLGANVGADVNGSGGTNAAGYELTGTSVRSLSPGKPIAVFSGSSRTTNPATCGQGGGDNDMAQLFPLHIWGKKYLTAPLSSSLSAAVSGISIYKILVNDPQTVVRKDGVILTGIINNSCYIYESNAPAFIEADQPILLAQFMTTSGCMAGTGDPDMYYLSPIEAGVKMVNCVRTSHENITVNYVTFIIPTAGIASLLIDGSNIFNHSYVHPSLPGYSVVIKSWVGAISQFTIQSDSAFTGITYGMGSVESYGYNIGANFKPNNGSDPMVPMLWSGSTSSSWFNGDNWNTRKIPTATDHVLMPAGTLFIPLIHAGAVAECSSISIENGATINIDNSGSLQVTGK